MGEREDYADLELSPPVWPAAMAQALLAVLVGACLTGVPLLLAALQPG